GGQILQFQTNGVSDKITPVFNGSVVYQPFEPTTLSLVGSHEIDTAYQPDLFTERTILNGVIRQRLFPQLYLTLVPAYNFQDYQTGTGDHRTTREDEYWSFYAGLSTRLLRKLDLAVFYQYGHNNSSQAGFGFLARQVGLRVDYRY